MKKENSRLSFWAQGRRRTLSRRQRGGTLYIRFMHRGKPLLRSLGTTSESLAKVKAKKIIDDAYDGNDLALRAAKLRTDFPLLTDFTTRFVERYGTTPHRRSTALGNVNALRRVVKLGASLTLEKARANVLNGLTVRKFQEAEEKRIGKDSHGNMIQDDERRVRTTICSAVRQARAIFAKGRLDWYEGLALPDLTSFRQQGVQSPELAKPRPPDEGAIAAINSDAVRISREDPPVYVAFLLFSRLGMRNREIMAARWSWITRRSDGSGRIGIIKRPEESFKPKAKSERYLTIPASTLGELEKFKNLSSDGQIVPGSSNQRHGVIYRRHSDWVRPFMPGRSKTSYELRRYAGSLIYHKTKDFAQVQQFLGHSTLKTTLDWYFYLINDNAPGIEMDDFAIDDSAHRPHLSVVAG